jgi:hypothetical protein
MADFHALKFKKVLKKFFTPYPFKIHFNSALLPMPHLPKGLLPAGLTTKI